MRRKIQIKGYDPETGELEDGEVQVPMWQWSPVQWAMFLAAVSAFITTLVTLFGGNPVGIPGAG